MLKIALITLLTLPLLADFFPKTVYSSIKSVNNQSIILNTPFPVNGMSGVVVHHYNKELNAITSRITQLSSNGEAVLADAEGIHHDSLPSIKTPVKKGDKVIGGYLYNNILLLAPDADTYAKITSQTNKKWIHPDLFAVYLTVEGEEKTTKENLADFAKKFQIGLVYIVRKNTAVLLDPISGKIISQKPITDVPQHGQFPFYMRFDKLHSGWFGSSSKGNYYQEMEAL